MSALSAEKDTWGRSRERTVIMAFLVSLLTNLSYKVVMCGVLKIYWLIYLTNILCPISASPSDFLAVETVL